MQSRITVDISGFTARDEGNGVSLDIKSLRLETGKIYALLGKSGNGKSLLLSLLSGFPHSGWIGRGRVSIDKNGGYKIFGVPIPASEFYSCIRLRKVYEGKIPGMVAYMPQILPINNLNRTSIKVELGFGLKATAPGILDAEIARISELVKKTLGADILKKSVAALSGGERKRFEILLRICGIRSFLDGMRGRSAIILMDEPTSGLDLRAEREFMGFIRDSFNKVKDRATMVVSTHALHLLCPDGVFFDEVAIIDGCTVKNQGTYESEKETINEIFYE